MTLRIAAIAAAIMLVTALALAFTASNTIPASNAGTWQEAITAQSLAPPECAGMGLTAVVTNGSGSNANDLVLGTGAADTLNGNNGDDCMLGGGGADVLVGGLGTDVCIGGAGIDTLLTCETAIQ